MHQIFLKIAGDFPFHSSAAKELMPEAPDVEETSKNLPWKCRSLKGMAARPFQFSPKPTVLPKP